VAQGCKLKLDLDGPRGIVVDRRWVIKASSSSSWLHSYIEVERKLVDAVTNPNPGLDLLSTRYTHKQDSLLMIAPHDEHCSNNRYFYPPKLLFGTHIVVRELGRRF
jgi:hypothetical protein